MYPAEISLTVSQSDWSHPQTSTPQTRRNARTTTTPITQAAIRIKR